WGVEDRPRLRTARSALPSLLKSATVTVWGSTPTGGVTAGRTGRTVRSSNVSSVNVCSRADRDSAWRFFSKRCNQDRAMRRTFQERTHRDKRPHGGGAGTPCSGGGAAVGMQTGATVRAAPLGRAPDFSPQGEGVEGIPLGAPHVSECRRKLTTSYYGRCWPDLAPGLGDFWPIPGVMRIGNGAACAPATQVSAPEPLCPARKASSGS